MLDTILDRLASRRRALAEPPRRRKSQLATMPYCLS
jgi:hypothetical protein